MELHLPVFILPKREMFIVRNILINYLLLCTCEADLSIFYPLVLPSYMLTINHVTINVALMCDFLLDIKFIISECTEQIESVSIVLSVHARHIFHLYTNYLMLSTAGATYMQKIQTFACAI